MNVNIHIDSIVLDGIDLPRHQQDVFQTTVAAELERLMVAGGLQPGLATGGALRSLSAGSILFSEEAKPVQLGQQIARAVYGGIGR